MNKEESRFPLEFQKCPVCGSAERVAELAVQEVEREKGIKREGSFASLEKIPVPLADPRKTTKLTLPVIINHFDICASCGQRYCTKVELVDAPIQFQMRGQPPSGTDLRGGRAGPF